MRSDNLLIIMSDQHNAKVLGCHDHPLIRTPNLDRLAERGTRFSNAYTHSPICVPARAAFATGRYLHDIRFWDNATPYDGSVPSWGHRLLAQGHYTRSIGKLHYRSGDDANGWGDEEIPMHVVDGVGDLLGSIRDRLELKGKMREVILNAGSGESSYTRYDYDIAERTSAWLQTQAKQPGDKPWTLFCSLVCPHPPLKAPDEFYQLYPLEQIPWPVEATEAEGWCMHPAIADYRRAFRWAEGFTEEQIRRARAAYFGMVTYLDHNIGKILETLNETGLSQTTRVIYTSDHGDNLGNHGLWNKNTLYEDAAAVPLIIAGADIPAGHIIDEPVNHLDCFPTILQATGCEFSDEDQELPGTSLLELANGGSRKKPMLLTQYHASGSTTGYFLIRKKQFKYIHYVAFAPQLFDLSKDPDEINDLAADPAYAGILSECEDELRELCDPEAIDAAAHADQAAKIEAWGGREAVIKRGSFGASPVPGEKAQFVSLPAR